MTIQKFNYHKKFKISDKCFDNLNISQNIYN